MMRKVIISLAAAGALALSGCAGTHCALRGGALQAQQSSAETDSHLDVAPAETDRFTRGSALSMNGGGAAQDSQDPIPILPNPDPGPSGSMMNPGNPGSSPLPSHNPVASFRR